MKHPSEEDLALYAFDPTTVACREEVEAHLDVCPECETTLAFIRSVESDLRDPEVWEATDRQIAAGREALRKFAGEVASEDDAAERLLTELLMNPARTAFANLGSKKAYLTAGVTRRLIRASADARERDPLEALTFADAAIDVAERLSAYPSGVLHDLRANAWKERAGALTVMAEYDSALEALTHAEREFSQAPAAPLGEPIVKHARAVIYYFRGELSVALKLAEESATAYSSLGETDLCMRARHLLANVAFGSGDVRRARTIYQELLERAEAEHDLRWIARENNTVGRCALELDDIAAAERHFQRSLRAYGDLGLAAEELRPRWGLGLVLLRSGNAAGALSQFTKIRAEFQRRAMLSDQALIALDIMDSLHALRRDAESGSIARDVMQVFISAGMLTSALAAFAYLKDAAQAGMVGPEQTRHVRSFLGRLEHAPELLFCQPEKN